jgi:hypothetical protein
MFLTVEPDFVHSSGANRISFPETNADFSASAASANLRDLHGQKKL